MNLKNKNILKFLLIIFLIILIIILSIHIFFDSQDIYIIRKIEQKIEKENLINQEKIEYYRNSLKSENFSLQIIDDLELTPPGFKTILIKK